MKRIITILTSVFLLSSCGPKLGDYYFDCDQIDHYSIEIDEGELFDRIDSTNLSEDELLQQAVILGDIPNSLSDTLFFSKLESAGFQKNEIRGSKLKEINEIFREKAHKETLATDCIAVYRDIFVFRKSGKIVGGAKVCFGCMQHQIHGTDSSTFQFGQSGDYAKLESILN